MQNQDTQTSFKRDSYGVIFAPTGDAVELLRMAITTALELGAKGKIPRAFDAMEWEKISSRKGSKRIGDARHHEIYDVTPDGKKILLCVRDVEGTKYGIQTKQKTYFFLNRHGRGWRAMEAPKSTVAKVSKECMQLGQAIAILNSQKVTKKE